MKFLFTISLIISCLFIAQTLGQSQFSPDAYSLFLQENQNIEIPTYQELCKITTTPNQPTTSTIPTQPTKPTEKEVRGKVI